MVTDEIRVFLNDYFDVLQSQDMSLFNRVFHQDCVLYSTQDGQTVVRSYQAYRDMVQGRASPQSMHAPREEQIVMLDLLSDEMALAKVQLRLYDNIMVDYLNLMKVQGSWRVVAKHFWRKGAAK
jgi:Putative lumazine-binding